MVELPVGSTAEPVEFLNVEHSSAKLAGAITAAWDWSEGRADKPIGALSENVIKNTVDVNLNNGAAKSDVDALFRALGIEAKCGRVSSINAGHTSTTTGARVYGQIRATTAAVQGVSGGATASNGTGNVAVGTVSYGSTSFGHHSSVSYLAPYGLGSVLKG